jgi:protein-tyrosine-phosphatase
MEAEKRLYTVLFLCTGNSARSILGEAILNQLGAGKFRSFSAGSNPTGQVNPYTVKLLKDRGYPTDELRSKSWDEFSGPDAPEIDFVFTVCDSAANESCPIWPGHPMMAHWGIPDPAAVQGPAAEKRLAFAEAYRMLDDRVRAFIDLPIASLDKATLQRHLRDIGRTFPESA